MFSTIFLCVTFRDYDTSTMIAKVQIFLYFLTLAGGSSQKIQNKAKNKAATLH